MKSSEYSESFYIVPGTETNSSIEEVENEAEGAVELETIIENIQELVAPYDQGIRTAILQLFRRGESQWANFLSRDRIARWDITQPHVSRLLTARFVIQKGESIGLKGFSEAFKEPRDEVRAVKLDLDFIRNRPVCISISMRDHGWAENQVRLERVLAGNDKLSDFLYRFCIVHYGSLRNACNVLSVNANIADNPTISFKASYGVGAYAHKEPVVSTFQFNTKLRSFHRSLPPEIFRNCEKKKLSTETVLEIPHFINALQGMLELIPLRNLA